MGANALFEIALGLGTNWKVVESRLEGERSDEKSSLSPSKDCTANAPSAANTGRRMTPSSVVGGTSIFSNTGANSWPKCRLAGAGRSNTRTLAQTIFAGLIKGNAVFVNTPTVSLSDYENAGCVRDLQHEAWTMRHVRSADRAGADLAHESVEPSCFHFWARSTSSNARNSSRHSGHTVK